MGRIAAAAIAVGVPATIGIAALLLFGPPRSSGAGWRLDPDASWPPPSADLASTVVPYVAAGESDVGLGITVYGSSSCPPKLRDVHIGSTHVTVDVTRGPIFGACTSDAAPHPFGITVEGDVLPAVPFDVVIRTDEREDRVSVRRLP